jgi:hypothetical protein
VKTTGKQIEICKVEIGERSVSLPGIVAVARRGIPVRIVGSAAFRGRPMDAAIEAVAREISENGFPKEKGWKRRNARVTK